MTGFAPHWEALPSTQREIWPQLAAVARQGLVLYGGTAVALRLGHRTSVDFDFFTEKPLDRKQLFGDSALLGRSTVIQDRPDTLTVLAPVETGSVKLSFFGAITIGRVGSPDRTPDGVLEVASLLDLLATKLKVVMQRIEAKDYQDVAAMIRAGERLESGLAAASVLYRPQFQPSEALKALTYFEGGDLASLPADDKNTLVRAATNVRQVSPMELASQSLSAQAQAHER